MPHLPLVSPCFLFALPSRVSSLSFPLSSPPLLFPLPPLLFPLSPLFFRLSPLLFRSPLPCFLSSLCSLPSHLSCSSFFCLRNLRPQTVRFKSVRAGSGRVVPLCLRAPMAGARRVVPWRFATMHALGMGPCCAPCKNGRPPAAPLPLRSLLKIEQRIEAPREHQLVKSIRASLQTSAYTWGIPISNRDP